MSVRAEPLSWTDQKSVLLLSLECHKEQQPQILNMTLQTKICINNLGL